MQLAAASLVILSVLSCAPTPLTQEEIQQANEQLLNDFQIVKKALNNMHETVGRFPESATEKIQAPNGEQFRLTDFLPEGKKLKHVFTDRCSEPSNNQAEGCLYYYGATNIRTGITWFLLRGYPKATEEWPYFISITRPINGEER